MKSHSFFKLRSHLNLFALALLLSGIATGVAPAAEPTRPNIVFLLCDDLGYGDVGCFGQKKFRTPNIDRLAAEGMRLTVHYSGSRGLCAVAVCFDDGHLTFGPRFHSARTSSSGPTAKDNGPFRHRRSDAGPELLKSLGYTTGAFGKWGLGAPDTTGEPLRQGIDRFFGYNCQAVAHNFYPTYLWDNAEKRLAE